MRKFIKSNYKINKVTKLIKSGNVEYQVYEVTGPDNFIKDFISYNDAKTFVAEFVDFKYNELINNQIKQIVCQMK